MRKITRKLLVSIFAITLSMFALGTATFAWFTLTDTATVSQFSANITSSDGIEVSLGTDNSAFYTSVPLSAVINYLNGAGYGDSFKMNHITSTDGKVFQDMRGEAKNNPTADGYIEIPMRIRSLSSNVPIYLSKNSGLSSDAKTWISDADFTNSKGKEVSAGQSLNYFIANAARFSVSSLAGENETVKLVYELPENAYGSETNVEYGNKVLNQTPQLNGAVHYYNQKNGLNSDITNNHENYTGLKYYEAEVAKSITTFVNQDPILVLSDVAEEDGYYYGIIYVRIWVEGWDPDCFDALLNSTLKIDLQFTTKKPTA